MDTLQQSASATNGAEGQPRKELTKRDRAFLGQLPDDFLRVEEEPRSRQQTSNVQRDHPHLVPMTYTPQVGHSSGNSIGKLKVTIAQAKLVKNYGLTRMDPYCRCRIGHSVYETPTDINGAKNPRWNKSFVVNLGRGVTSMYVEVFNERYLSLDDRVAWGYYEFPEDLYNHETVEEWIPLTGKQGDEKEGNVNVILSLSAMPDNVPYQLSAYGAQPVNMVAVPGGYPQYQQYPQYPNYPGMVPGTVPTQQQQQPPAGPPPPPQIKEEDVKQLQEMFPTCDADVVRSVLEAARGNTDQAVTNLLSMTTN